MCSSGGKGGRHPERRVDRFDRPIGVSPDQRIKETTRLYRRRPIDPQTLMALSCLIGECTEWVPGNASEAADQLDHVGRSGFGGYLFDRPGLGDPSMFEHHNLISDHLCVNEVVGDEHGGNLECMEMVT